VGSHPKCYLNGLSSCSERISKEHTISKAILKQIGSNEIKVTGFPWLQQGEERAVGIASLTTNCLCEEHNNRLSPLDSAAGSFFRALQQCRTTVTGTGERFLFSGHDIERWMLKTLLGMAAGKNLANERRPLRGDFDPDVDVADLLQNPASWKRPAGLYFTQRLGAQFKSETDLQLAPLSRLENDSIVGLLMGLQGFQVTLLATPSVILEDAGLMNAVYRLERLNFLMQSKHFIQVCWENRLE
jgi:hypothetical protein